MCNGRVSYRIVLREDAGRYLESLELAVNCREPAGCAPCLSHDPWQKASGRHLGFPGICVTVCMTYARRVDHERKFPKKSRIEQVSECSSVQAKLRGEDEGHSVRFTREFTQSDMTFFFSATRRDISDSRT